MLSGHFTTCAEITERKKKREKRGREGVKREITSHPTTPLLNYNNLTHMGWPTTAEGAARRAALGDHSPASS